jgi:phosphonate transport system ATP-binding protein
MACQEGSVEQYRLEKIAKIFGRSSTALNGVDLSVQRGEKVALIGPSGAGKTTLFRILNLTLRPSSGKLWINGSEVENLHGRRLREARRRIGTVYQQHNLVPRLKVIHNVLSGQLGRWSTVRSLASLVRPAEVELACHALKQVGIGEKIFTRTDELSGGQQQRVAIARVLLQEPEVILADEPVSSVDPSLATAIVKLMLQISEETGKTLLVNLHSVDLALSHFPRVIGVKNGAIVFDLPPDKVTEDLLADLYSGHLPEKEQDSIFDEESRVALLQ